MQTQITVESARVKFVRQLELNFRIYGVVLNQSECRLLLTAKKCDIMHIITEICATHNIELVGY